MSYNIDTWKTKRLVDFTIPLAAFYQHERQDWHPKQPVLLDASTNIVSLACGCEQTITGILTNGMLEITAFEMTGEGSGIFFRWILEPALHQSMGQLEAVLIWEGGDCIERLLVEKGAVTREDVEL